MTAVPIVLTGLTEVEKRRIRRALNAAPEQQDVQRYVPTGLAGVRHELERFVRGDDNLFGFPRTIDLTAVFVRLDAAIAST